MSLSTFPQFPHLPLELQLRIWSYAASPCGPALLSDTFFRVLSNYHPSASTLVREFFSLTSPRRLYLGTEAYKAFSFEYKTGDTAERARKMRRLYVEERELKAKAKSTAQARGSVGRACRVARVVVWECWRREVEGIEVVGERDGSVELNEELKAEAEVVRREVLEMLDGWRAGLERGEN